MVHTMTPSAPLSNFAEHMSGYPLLPATMTHPHTININTSLHGILHLFCHRNNNSAPTTHADQGIALTHQYSKGVPRVGSTDC
jgi:hypothetical protein